MKSADWTPTGGLKLEPNALAAIKEDDRSVAVTAGPGAGKTEMLAQKADFLLRTGACFYPQRILAIAFKVDASANLRDRVRLRCPQDFADRFESYTFHGFAKKIIDNFRPLLKGQDALDPNYTIGEVRVTRTQITFRDLVPLALEILKSSPMVRSAIAQTYSHVFLDEFQDCTGEQFELVKLAFLQTGAYLTAVGDTKQKIMGFAGALEGVFLSFAKEFNALPLNLYLNFRSKPRLRRMQNEMVKRMDPKAAAPDNQLVGDEGEIIVRQYPSDSEEAVAVADKIQQMIEIDGLRPSEIAVLVSMLPECFTYKLTKELLERKIPFRDEKQMQDLAKEPVVELLIAFLRSIFFDRDPESYGIVDGFFSRYQSQQDEDRKDDGFKRLIAQYRKAVRKKTFEPTDAILRKMTSALRKVAGDTALRSLLPDYVQGSRLDSLIEELHTKLTNSLSEGLPIAEALSRFGEDNAVKIMTVHKSKGLEFHTVIAMGIENQSFFNAIEVERSVFFVMISRAKERLFLTCCKQRPRPPFYNRRWDEARTAHKEFLTYGIDAAGT